MSGEDDVELKELLTQTLESNGSLAKIKVNHEWFVIFPRYVVANLIERRSEVRKIGKNKYCKFDIF